MAAGEGRAEVQPPAPALPSYLTACVVQSSLILLNEASVEKPRIAV